MKTILKILIPGILFFGCSSAPNLNDPTSVKKYLQSHTFVDAQDSDPDKGKITFTGDNISFSLANDNYIAPYTLGAVNYDGLQIIIDGDVKGNNEDRYWLQENGAIIRGGSGIYEYYLAK